MANLYCDKACVACLTCSQVHSQNLKSMALFPRPCPAFHHLQYVLPVTDALPDYTCSSTKVTVTTSNTNSAATCNRAPPNMLMPKGSIIEQSWQQRHSCWNMKALYLEPSRHKAAAVSGQHPASSPSKACYHTGGYKSINR